MKRQLKSNAINLSKVDKMLRTDKIYIPGHRGLVGSALVRTLINSGYQNLLLRTRQELDLCDQHAVDMFFKNERPDYVFLAAAKVGGIVANDTMPADFIYENLAIELGVINAAYRYGVKRLIFLGSNCAYPKYSPQPIKEEYLLSGHLEETNRPYALAKIAGIEMCWAYNRQHNTRFLSVMPINLYGRGDNYQNNNSHVLPALIRRFHEAKVSSAPSVTVWGTGNPLREFMCSDDMASACLFLMQLTDQQLEPFLGLGRNSGVPPLINIGSNQEYRIAELARLIATVVDYKGIIFFDQSKPDGTPRKKLDTSIMDSLGWNPSVPLIDGLKLAYADFLSNETRR